MAFLATSIAFLAVFPSLQAKMNVPIVFSTQKSLKIQIFSLVQKVDLILLHSVIDAVSYLVLALYSESLAGIITKSCM